MSPFKVKCNSRSHVPQPDRIRKIEKSFAWIDHRLLRHGYVEAMTHHDQSLYLFLVLAADRRGVSFYHPQKICYLLGLTTSEFQTALERLLDLRLVAFDESLPPRRFYQVLPVDGHAPGFEEGSAAKSRPHGGDDGRQTASPPLSTQTPSVGALRANTAQSDVTESPEELAQAREAFFKKVRTLFKPQDS